MTPPTVFPDPLKVLEDEAYRSAEDAAEDGSREYRDYAHLGPAISERPYRPGVLKEWPIHMDFRPHETTAEERWRWD
jgi:hypothetical protein